MKRIFLNEYSAHEFRALIGSEIREAMKELQLNKKAENEILLTRKEAAGMLKISLVSLNDWTRRGLVQSYSIGGRVYYKANELEASLHKTQTVKY